jgi:hypothetical protein
MAGGYHQSEPWIFRMLLVNGSARGHGMPCPLADPVSSGFASIDAAEFEMSSRCF